MKLTRMSCALAGAWMGAAAAGAAPVVYQDLRYGAAEPQSRQTLDLYLPENTANAPILMYIHGGAWFAGSKADPPGLDAFLDAGIGVASMNYRLSTYDFPATPESGPGTRWPGQLEDLENAFAFLRNNGSTFGYDGSRLASFGSSAGAHLAAWAGLALADDPATALQAAVTWYAPTDLYEMDNDDDNSTPAADAINHSGPTSPESLLIGATVGDNEALADAASPAVYASHLQDGAPLPAFLIMHGRDDALVSYLQSQRLFDALSAQGGSPRLELSLFEGYGYGGPGWDSQIPRVVNFVAQEFGVAPVPLPATLPLSTAAIAFLAAASRRSRRRSAA